MTHWHPVLDRPSEGQHIVQVYQDDDFLIDAMAHFVRAGLAQGEGVVVFATSSHWEACVCRLAAEGISLQDAELRGQLAVMDARTALSAFMVDGMPDWKAFQDVVGTAINLTRRKCARVRAYSEMVNVLWQRGERAAALRLEALWNHLLKVQDLALCCAYRIDTLREESYGGALEQLCALHSHVIPARDYEEFEKRINRAADAVLGSRTASMLRLLAAARRPPADMPDAQSTMLWMKQHMPITAGKVLARARAEPHGTPRRHKQTAPAHT